MRSASSMMILPFVPTEGDLDCGEVEDGTGA